MEQLIDFAINHQYNQSVQLGKTPLSVIENLVGTDFAHEVNRFHQSIPGFKASPLIKLNKLADKLSVSEIWVKDESTRFDLKAFKVLGASYAIAKHIQAKALPSKLPLDFKKLKAFASNNNIHIATATDGNHGRAVAWCAHKLGCKAHVFMPKGSSQFRLDAIAQFAQQAEITELNYDNTVALVSRLAKENKWTLIQDTAWEGYEIIPADIKRGYFSLITEFEKQSPKDWPTHVFLQAGVGSMAAAIAAYFVKHKNPTPHIIVVEPEQAPCFFNSMKVNDGKAHLFDEEMNTIMAGLACGLPSTTAWQILKSTARATLKCHDKISAAGMRRYAQPVGGDKQLISGESAAVTLGALEYIMSLENIDRVGTQETRDFLKLDKQSKILLFSTEGDTDPKIYQSVINNEIFS